jgi:hypothetical protein
LVRGLCAKLGPMTTRQRIDAVLNNMPESELEPVLEILISRTGEEYDPEAAKPGDIIDDWGNLSAMTRRSTARAMKRLSEEEIAANGETLADAWGYEPKHPR